MKVYKESTEPKVATRPVATVKTQQRVQPNRPAPVIKERLDIRPYQKLRGEVIEFPSRDYVYVDVVGNKLIAGDEVGGRVSADYSIAIDGSKSVDENLQALYDVIIEDHPEYIDDMIADLDMDEDLITEEYDKGTNQKLARLIETLIYEVKDLHNTLRGSSSAVAPRTPTIQNPMPMAEAMANMPNAATQNFSLNGGGSALAMAQQIANTGGLGKTMAEQLAEKNQVSNTAGLTVDMNNPNPVSSDCTLNPTSYDDDF